MVTQKDVAKSIGITSSTVSRFINNKGYLSDELRQKIKKAIKELDYKPNLIARSLKNKSSNTIGLIFPDIENEFFISLIKKAEETAFKNGYNIILCNTNDSQEEEELYLEILKGKLIDGYILITSFKVKKYLEKIIGNLKVVFLDRSLKFKNEVFIKLNNIEGAFKATDYLLSQGHRKIGFLSHISGMGITEKNKEVMPSHERYLGYKKALDSYNINIDKSLIRYCESNKISGYEKSKELFTQKNKPTAILTSNNKITFGVLKALKELRLEIPDQVSVIGFDELSASEFLNPPLTTIAQPAYEFGRIGIELLIKKIKNQEIENKTIILEPELIIRESVKKLD